jgi:hypothetical protein
MSYISIFHLTSLQKELLHEPLYFHAFNSTNRSCDRWLFCGKETNRDMNRYTVYRRESFVLPKEKQVLLLPTDGEK